MITLSSFLHSGRMHCVVQKGSICFSTETVIPLHGLVHSWEKVSSMWENYLLTWGISFSLFSYWLFTIYFFLNKQVIEFSAKSLANYNEPRLGYSCYDVIICKIMLDKIEHKPLYSSCISSVALMETIEYFHVWKTLSSPTDLKIYESSVAFHCI